MPEQARRERRKRARAGIKGLHFPWRGGNRVALLSDGPEFYPRMLADIDTAQRYILLEMYLVNSGRVADRFIDALAAAAGRGVAVFVLLDAFGSMGLARRDRQRLAQSGVTVTYYNPLHFAYFRRNLLRNHRKLLLIDGRAAYTGGAGLSDEFNPADTGVAPWHDFMVRAEGPVTGDWQRLFRYTWDRYAEQALPLPESPQDAASPAPVAARVAFSHRRRNSDMQRALLKQLRAAQQRIWIATAYFLPSWKLRRTWRRAARRGVDVRLLLPGPHTDHPAVRYAGQRFYAKLLLAGVRIYEYQPSFLHAKAALCDDWCSIGSSNMDRWNLRWNLEANQELHDAGFAAELQAQFERDFELAYEYQRHTWGARSRYARTLQWFWGKIDLWVDRTSQVRAGGAWRTLRWMHWLRLPWRGRRD